MVSCVYPVFQQSLGPHGEKSIKSITTKKKPSKDRVEKIYKGSQIWGEVEE